jgi:hypothetical protein
MGNGQAFRRRERESSHQDRKRASARLLELPQQDPLSFFMAMPIDVKEDLMEDMAPEHDAEAFLKAC